MINQNKNQNISNSPMVSLKRINHFYDKFKSLSEISFDINQGEIVSLLGPSGSGKTTMLRIIAGLEKPKNGELYLWGDDACAQLGHSASINQEYSSGQQKYKWYPIDTQTNTYTF